MQCIWGILASGRAMQHQSLSSASPCLQDGSHDMKKVIRITREITCLAKQPSLEQSRNFLEDKKCYFSFFVLPHSSPSSPKEKAILQNFLLILSTFFVVPSFSSISCMIQNDARTLWQERGWGLGDGEVVLLPHLMMT